MYHTIPEKQVSRGHGIETHRKSASKPIKIFYFFLINPIIQYGFTIDCTYLTSPFITRHDALCPQTLNCVEEQKLTMSLHVLYPLPFRRVLERFRLLRAGDDLV